LNSEPQPIDVSIVIPTLNEADNIDPLLTAIFDAVGSESFHTEVIVVDDGSTDATRALVRGWSEHHPVRLVERDDARGLSGAVIAGANAARGQAVVVMDADLSHPANVLAELIKPILSGQSDVVIGSRYMRGGGTVGWPLKRKLISRSASLLAWPLVDVADPMSGFFATRRERLLAVDPDAKGFKIGLEVLAGLPTSARVQEVPIIFREREAGHSKLGTGQVFAYLDRLRVLAGGRVSGSTAMRFGVVGLLGMLVDGGSFSLLMLAGIHLSVAHLLSFAIASVFNFTLNIRWSFRVPGEETMKINLSRGLRYLVVLLLALSLRGAVLGMLIDELGWVSLPSAIIAIGLAAVVSYLGYAFFVFPSSDERMDTSVRWRIACVGVVGYLLLIRFFNMGLTELLMEEAYYWNYAQHLSLGYLDHPPMVAWLIGLGTWLFGDTEFGVRSGAMLCWGLTAWFGYATAREMFDKSAAMRTVLLLAILPFFFSIGFFITPDAPMTACWAGTIYFLQRVLLGGHAKSWWGVGLMLGLGMLSKYSIAVLGPAIILYLILNARSRRWFISPRPYAAVLLALLVFSPVIYWNWLHDWASFAFQTVDRIQSEPEFGLPVLLGSCVLLLTPLGFYAGLSALGGGWRKRGKRAGRQSMGMSEKHLFALVFTGVPLLVFIAFSINHEPKLNWTGPIWLAVLPLVAARMLPAVMAGPKKTAKKFGREQAWTLTAVLTTLGYGVFLYYVSVGLPGVAYPKQFIFAGWRDLGGQIEAIEDQVQAERGEEPLVVGLDKYGISSRLAFYRLRDEPAVPHDDELEEGVTGTSGRHLLGGGSLMYSYWQSSDTQAGRDIIMVDKNMDRLSDEQVAGYFDSVSAVQSLDVESHGHSAGSFYYRIGYGYRPEYAGYAKVGTQ